MSGFRVALPNPDAVDSWMVKNGLYPLGFGLLGLSALLLEKEVRNQVIESRWIETTVAKCLAKI